MDEIKQEIISLCSNLFGQTKAEVKKNNKSVDRLIQIFEKVKINKKYAHQLYKELLYYNDDKVRFEAATCCMKLNVNVKEAKKVLFNILEYNSNPAIRFSAEMVLERWQEEGCL